MLDLSRLSPADLAYLSACVSAGRILRRARSMPTRFAAAWLRGYADEHAGVTYLEKRRRLRYHWLEKERQDEDKERER